MSSPLVLFSAPISFSIHHCSNKTINGVFPLKAKVIMPEKNSDFRPKCGSSISEQRTAEEGGALPTFKWNGFKVKEEEGEALEAFVIKDKIRKRVEAIRLTLESEEGEKRISVSAYSTAWVALVEDINGSGSPQFPSSLQWIIDNQLPDGSWGDSEVFVAYDRLICTLASIIVLRRWNVHPKKVEKGLKFFEENINKLETENREHMTCGFEIILPSLLQLAKSLNVDVPDDFPALKEIFARKDEKLRRIPMDVLHKGPTSLRFSLESIPGLQWEKLLKLQNEGGSFMFSPSSTAFAFMQSKDRNCLNYLNKVVQDFNGGAPEAYPIDFFEQLWIVDRLERLGISRYFEPKIKEILNYVYRYWNEKGLGWTRHGDLPDLDDTAMGFRLLRLNGYEVSASVFKNFERDGEFICMPGQSDEGASVMFNVYRASQVQFPGEKVLGDGRNFVKNFLTKKLAANRVLDKWLIAKDLHGEVSYALGFPWYASLPRIETRFYLEQYGGADDVWIAKALYRLHRVNNNTNLELGKLDYNNCQSLHRTEWKRVQEWYSECGLEELGLSKERLLLAYFVAAVSIFEPERSHERLAWVKTSALVETITSNYHHQEQRKAFVHDFNNSSTTSSERWLNKNKSREGLLGTLLETLHYFSQRSPAASFHILHDTWKKWLLGWQSEGDKWEGEAELLVKMININGGYELSQESELNPHYKRLLQLSNSLCYQLSALQSNREHHGNGSYNRSTNSISNLEIESEMQELVQLVLSSNGIDFNMKKTFLTVTKSFYYAAHCDSTTINSHIAKVLFEKVV